MRRQSTTPRTGWQKKVEKVGLTFHALANGTPYWDESAYWEFSSAEIDRLEEATAELQKLALAAGDAILDQDRLSQMGIPREAAAAIRAAWNSEPPAIYGRFDLAYDGFSIKLLEYNADTPTGLLEASVVQWYWLQDCFPHSDQFNSIHEKLIAKWKDLKDYTTHPIYFASSATEEDILTVNYLRDTAEQAGIQTQQIRMSDIGWDLKRNCFVDMRNQAMGTLFKLYPWEWLLKETFGANALSTLPPNSQLQEYGPRKDRRQWGSMLWIEPIWKMMWSNKALLAILWELNPRHELLLPTYLDGPRDMRSYVRKPLLGREGSGIAIVQNGRTTAGSLDGDNAQGYVYQALASMAQANGKTAVLGSWLIDGEPAGMGIRESIGPVTDNTSSFVPHLFH